MTFLSLVRASQSQSLNESENTDFEQLHNDWFKINSYLETIGKKQGMQIKKHINFKYSKRPTTLNLATLKKFEELDKLSISSGNSVQHMGDLHINDERMYVVFNNGDNFICKIDIIKSGAILRNIVNHIRNNSFSELLGKYSWKQLNKGGDYTDEFKQQHLNVYNTAYDEHESYVGADIYVFKLDHIKENGAPVFETTSIPVPFYTFSKWNFRYTNPNGSTQESDKMTLDDNEQRFVDGINNGVTEYMNTKQIPKLINLQTSVFANFVDFLKSQGKENNIRDYKAIRISPMDFAKLPDEQIAIKDIYKLLNGNYDSFDEISSVHVDELTAEEKEELTNEYNNIQRNKINPADMIIFDTKRIKETTKLVNFILKDKNKTNKKRINLFDKLYDDGLVYTVSLKQPKNGVNVTVYTPKPCEDVSVDIDTINKNYIEFTNRKTITQLNNRSTGIFSSRNCNIGIITYIKNEDGELEKYDTGSIQFRFKPTGYNNLTANMTFKDTVTSKGVVEHGGISGSKKPVLLFSKFGGNITGRNKQQQLANATQKLVKETFGGVDVTAQRKAVEMCDKEPKKVVEFLRNDKNIAFQLSLLQIVMNGFNGGGVAFVKQNIKERSCLNAECVHMKFDKYFPNNDKGDELLVKFFKVVLENSKIKTSKGDVEVKTVLSTMIDFGLMKNLYAIFYEKCVLKPINKKIISAILDEVNMSKSTMPNISVKHLKMA